MPSEWRDLSLGEFVRLQRGHDLTASEQQAGNVPVMGSAGPNGTHSEALAKGPGVVIGRSGASIGRVHYSPVDYWPHNTCLYVTDFLGNHPRFAYYLLQTLDLASYNSGSAQPSLNRNYVYGLRLQAPAPDEQAQIVAVLHSIDDRIDLLRQTNATLESIAQALFKSWFIDFDPVRAKAEGREPEGMDVATAALFPAEFEESALGLIPKGWHVGTFGNLAVLGKGAVNPMDFPTSTFEHYSLPAFDAGQLPVLEEGAAIKSNKTRVPRRAVLQSKLNPHIPRVWFVDDTDEKAVCSTEFLPWIAREGVSPELIYCTLRSPSFEAQVRTLVTGTSNSHQRVKPDQVASLEFVAAPLVVVGAFTALVEPMLGKAKANRLKAQNLAELRDTLLPRLISGKLRLPEAQEQLDEALA
ncbi:restriction endonuclease subunit S [Rubrivivax sp. JA1024]|nr:restriction endonuclease subunit S [Rubrivivax sp. JA1024]